MGPQELAIAVGGFDCRADAEKAESSIKVARVEPLPVHAHRQLVSPAGDGLDRLGRTAVGGDDRARRKHTATVTVDDHLPSV